MTHIINDLKMIFGEALITDKTEENSLQYKWYTAENGQFFGIDLGALTEKEKALLNAFLPSQLPETKHYSTAAELWHAFIERDDQNSLRALHPFITHDEAHLICFSYKKTPEDYTLFETILTAYFDVPCTLIINGPNESCAIVQGAPKNNYIELIDILAADLFIAIKMLASPSVKIQKLPKLFSTVKLLFGKAMTQYPNSQFFHYHDLILLGLLSLHTDEQRKMLFAPFQDLLKDTNEETLKTLLVFFDHDLNATNTSKALFIHRNSLNYRLEKFHEQSGLDPKSFHDAILIKLLIEEQRHLILVEDAQ